MRNRGIFLLALGLLLFALGCNILEDNPQPATQEKTSVSLKLPQNNSFHTIPKIDFVWEGNANNYYLYLKKPDQPETMINDGGVGKSFSKDNLRKGLYYWRVIGYRGYDKDGEDELFSFIMEDTVNIELLYPTNGATALPESFTFSWKSNGDTFFLYLDKDKTTPTTLFTKTVDTSFAGANMPFGNSTYYWFVSAKSAGGQLISSPTYSFTTDSIISLSLLEPLDSVILATNSDTLVWSSDANTFAVYADVNPNPTTLLTSSTTSKTHPISGFDFLTRIYWKVVAKNTSSGQTKSATGSFVPVEKLDPIKLSKVYGGEDSTKTTVQVSWNRGNATGFKVVWSGDKSNLSRSKAIGSSDTTYSITEGLSYGANKYYYRVFAYKTFNQVDSTIIDSFITNNQIDVELTSPKNRDTLIVSSDSATLSWSSSGDSFYIYLDTLADFSTKVLVASTTDTLAKAKVNKFEKIHYWKVSAVDTSNNITITKNDSFVPVEKLDTTLLLSPADDSSGMITPVPLIWRKNNANSYEVLWGSDVNNLTNSIEAQGDTMARIVGIPYNGATYYWKVVSTKAGSQRSSSETRSFTMDVGLYLSLDYPVDTVIVDTFDVVFRWTSSLDSFALYSDGNANPTAFVGSTTNKTFTHTIAAFETLYYWQILAKDLSTGRVDSAVTSFVAVQKLKNTTLLSPFNGQQGVSIAPLAKWSNGNAQSYKVYWGTDSANWSDSSASTTKDTLTLGGLSYGPNTYFWQVKSFKKANQTGKSAVYGFATDTPLNLTIVPPATQVGDTIISDSQKYVMSWTSNGDSFYLERGTDPNFSSVNISVQNTSSPFIDTSSATPLIYGTKYYWRVIATDTSSKQKDTLSDTFVVIQTLDTTALLSPSSGITGRNILQVVDWSNTNAEFYKLYWGPTSSANANSLTIADTTSLSTLGGFSYGNNAVYWKVVAYKAANQSNTSSTWSFTTDQLLTLSMDKSDQTVADTIISDSAKKSFVWSSNADTYHIYVDDNSDFSSPAIDVDLKDTFYQWNVLNFEQTYFWKVVATDTSSNQIDTLIDTFVVVETIDTAKLLSPTNGTMGTGVSVPVIWDSVNANSYEIYYGTTNPPAANFAKTDDTTHTITGLSYGNNTYFWQVKSFKKGNQTSTSEVYSFSTEEQLGLTLTAPNKDTVVSLNKTFTFKWTKSGSPDEMTIRFGTTPDPNSITYSAGPLDSLIQSFYTFKWDEKIYWEVTVKSSSTGQTFEQSSAFTPVEVLKKPTLVFPNNLDSLVDTAFTFKWSRGNANSFKIYWSKDSTFTTSSSGTPNDSTFDVSRLGFDSTYFWRVVAYKKGGQIDTSVVWKFKTEPEVLLTHIAGDSLFATPQSYRFKNADFVVYDWRVNDTSLAKVNIPMKDSSNSGGTDYSTNGSNAVFFDSVIWGNDYGSENKGGIYIFGDGNDSIILTPPVVLASDFTIMGSINLEETKGSSADGLFFDSNGNNDFNFTSNYAQFDTSTVDAIKSESKTGSAWNSHILKREASALKIYKNGVADAASGSWSGPLSINQLASSRTPGEMRGEIELFLVFNKALSNAQIGRFATGDFTTILNSDLFAGNWSVVATAIKDGVAQGTIYSNSIAKN